MEVTASVYAGMPISSRAHVLPWSATKHHTSACRPSTALHITPVQAAGVSDTSPTPRNAHVQPAQYLSDKSSQGPSKSWDIKYIWFPPPPPPPQEISFKKFGVWHCVRDKWTLGGTGDTQHFPVSVHERGASWVQLCAVEKDFCPLLVLLLSFGEQGEERAVCKYFNSSPLLMQDPALREQRQAVYLLFSPTFQRQWEHSRVPPPPHAALQQGHPTCPVCHCATLVVLRALLWARGQPPKWGTQWGSSSIHDWARGQLFHVKKSWGTSGDAPALASCWGTLVLRAGIRSKLQASRFRSSGGLNNLCWHCCALLDGIFQSLLSPKYKSWIQAIAWCSHPLQPNRHFGLDAPVAQW